MLQFHWVSTTITTNRQAYEMVELFNKVAPEIGAFDTETNGLHIIACKPFLFQFGFLDMKNKIGHTFAVDIERQPQLAKQVIVYWNKLAATLKLYLGHHITFDLHMIANIGLPYTTENMSDTMFYIRYAHDAIATKNGGPPLALKEYSAQYIDPSAKYHEHILDTEKTSIAKELNLKLKIKLQNLVPPEKYGAKSYTLKLIQTIFKDPIADYTNLPDDAQEAYLDWLQNDVPIYLQKHVQGIISSDMIPYNILNRANVIKYAHFDIIYTLEIFLKLAPVVQARKNEAGLKIDNDLIIPLFEMERVGFDVDKQYLLKCKHDVKVYTQERRAALYELLGEEVSIGQHAKIKQLFESNFGIELESTNADVIDLIKVDLIHSHSNPKAVEFIEVLQELRTLEKWYSTYIIRFENDLKESDRLYTTIHQVGTVTGRVTSNFQQFPKEGILKADGTELFNPRHIVKISGGHNTALMFADYSQIELRMQAFYTILVGSADLNLCRAYMPYKCIHKDGHSFDCHNKADIKDWNGDWYLEEDQTQKWIPTDVHGATAHEATGLNPGDEGFAHARSKIGKKVNFAKNYGAKFGRIKQMFPEKTDAELHKIDNAYYKAFPGVKGYHQYCYDRAAACSNTANLFDVRYYNVSGHKLINMLIQGSAAYYLKIKERQIYDYCKANNVYSKWQMQVHDELFWEYDDRDDPSIILKFKEIMEDWDDTLVPLIAEVDMSTTTWDAKKGVNGLDEIRLRLST